jgi:hypothetical protein
MKTFITCQLQNGIDPGFEGSYLEFLMRTLIEVFYHMGSHNSPVMPIIITKNYLHPSRGGGDGCIVRCL